MEYSGHEKLSDRKELVEIKEIEMENKIIARVRVAGTAGAEKLKL
jgi:hypothetical protein